MIFIVIYPVRCWLCDTDVSLLYMLIITDGFRGKWPHCRRCKFFLYIYHAIVILSLKLMHEIMVKPLPAGCRLTAIFDVSLQKRLTICDVYTHILQNSLVTPALHWVSSLSSFHN